MTIDRAKVLLCQMYLPHFDEEESQALTIAINSLCELRELREENYHLKCELQSIGATIDLLEKEIRENAIYKFATTLIPRLKDAIHTKEIDSITNLINDVVKELKTGEDEW